MTESMQKKLSKKNALTQELYEDKIKEDVRKEMSADDELAILRKAVAKLFEIVSTLHKDEINNAEFEEYNELIESIKRKHKEIRDDEN
jgi:negative regulator of replication initiation